MNSQNNPKNEFLGASGNKMQPDVSPELSADSTAGRPAGVPVFYNRELSWLDFNERVLEEGCRKDLPPMERFKYLSIVSSNFDEFFMVRVAAIKRVLEAGGGADISGLSPAELLERIYQKVRSIFDRYVEALQNEVLPELARGGLSLVRPLYWTDTQRIYLESLFVREVFPLLTPLKLEDTLPLPLIENNSLYVAFLLEPETYSQEKNSQELYTPEIDASGQCFSLIRIPPAPTRIIWLPKEVGKTGKTVSDEERSGGYIQGELIPRDPVSGSNSGGNLDANTGNNPAGNPAGSPADAAVPAGGVSCWALMEDMVQTWGAYIYPGYKVKESLVFKINRDADFSVDEKRDEDFIEAMAEVLESRERSMVVRMVYTPGSVKVRDYLAHRLSLDETDLFGIPVPLNIGNLYDHVTMRGFDHLKEKPWRIYNHPQFSDTMSIWDCIRAGDQILHLPYQSFDPVVRFFQEAAADPDVTVIKTALYRTSGDSPIVRALEQASLAGKNVTAVVELKARFDEGRNISWAYRLEKAGVIVVYGLARLKIHAKVTLVIRREYNRIKRYVHLSTGNYNDKTAKLYEDICLFSAREDIAYDAGLLFNMITGYSAVQLMGRLFIAPMNLKRRLLELIEREIYRSKAGIPGKIMAKMNSLADPKIIQALYDASKAGVQVQLNVRGICMLVPGVKGLSENIRVVSIIDHYLEHSRIYYFANGGAEEMYLASADWMPRNLERRVELMFPVLDDNARTTVYKILSSYFRDNCQAWQLTPDGVWKRLTPARGEKPFRAQTNFLSWAAREQAELHPGTSRGEFIVRRSPPGELKGS